MTSRLLSIIILIINRVKGSFHLWKDEYVFKMGNLCRRNVKLFLDLELSRLRKARNFFLAYVDKRQQLPECTCFAALGGHAYRA